LLKEAPQPLRISFIVVGSGRAAGLGCCNGERRDDWVSFLRLTVGSLLASAPMELVRCRA